MASILDPRSPSRFLRGPFIALVAALFAGTASSAAIVLTSLYFGGVVVASTTNPAADTAASADPCNGQTWPYVDDKCAEKMRAANARPVRVIATDQSAPPTIVATPVADKPTNAKPANAAAAANDAAPANPPAPPSAATLAERFAPVEPNPPSMAAMASIAPASPARSEEEPRVRPAEERGQMDSDQPTSRSGLVKVDEPSRQAQKFAVSPRWRADAAQPERRKIARVPRERNEIQAVERWVERNVPAPDGRIRRPIILRD